MRKDIFWGPLPDIFKMNNGDIWANPRGYYKYAKR